MTTLREAALMALKALEFGHLPVADQAKHRDVMSYIEAMDVLRKALDADSMASLPEPVAWRTFDGEGGYEFRYYQDNEEYQQRFIERNGEQYASWVAPLYTTPPKRKPLTDGQIGRLCGKFDARHSVAIGIAREIERAHGIGEKE